MNISLTNELEKFVQDKVKSGMYTSASEVIYDDLQKQRIIQLNQAIEVGMTQLAQGKCIEGDKSYQKMKNKIDSILFTLQKLSHNHHQR